MFGCTTQQQSQNLESITTSKANDAYINNNTYIYKHQQFCNSDYTRGSH